MTSKIITILGASGSIGASTLEVVRASDHYTVFAVTGCKNLQKIQDILTEFNPEFVVMIDEQSAEQLRTWLLSQPLKTQILFGVKGLIEVAIHSSVDTVVAGIVGLAGLEPTLAAARAGKKILLANKESMVMAGELFRTAISDFGAQIMPVDSEHNAIFQCLPYHIQSEPLIRQPQCEGFGIKSLVLTASGGPFLNYSQKDLKEVTPAQACKHPNWSMGQKVSIDSASLMNKGLELIEACYLFGVDESYIDVVIHPQSIVHSMVSYIDGTTLAQLSHANMQVPIASGLAWPLRVQSGVETLSWGQALQLDFLPLSVEQFPCFGLARDAMKAGQAAPAVLSIANEVAVEAFVEGHIGFTDIYTMNAELLDTLGSEVYESLEDLVQLEHKVKDLGFLCLEKLKNTR